MKKKIQFLKIDKKKFKIKKMNFFFAFLKKWQKKIQKLKIEFFFSFF